MLMTQVKEEKEQTIRQQRSKETLVEEYERQHNKIGRLINSLFLVLKDALEACQERSREVDHPNMQMEDIGNLTKQVLNFGNKDGELSELLIESESIARKLVDWINISGEEHKKQIRVIGDQRSELKLATEQLHLLEKRVKGAVVDETELREKEKFLATEAEDLRNKLREADEQKKEAYYREEKIQKTNSSIKLQLESFRKEQEKLLMQLKSVISEKEKL